MKQKNKKYTVQTYYDSRDKSHSLRLSELYFANEYSIDKGKNAIFSDRNNKIEFVCGYCKQPLCISGGVGKSKQRLHFKHKCQKDGPHCIYKEQKRLSEEEINRIKFNGAKESLAHKEIKEFIVQQLRSLGCSDIKQEEYIWDKCQPKSYRIGDVTATFQDKEFVFEIQLSTTFLHVISGRTKFYNDNGKYLIWVLNNFSEDSDKQLFTQKDILVQNLFNVFVLDDEAKRRSIKENTLYFHCYYVDFRIEGDKIQGDFMKSQYVKFSDLTFRESDHKAYYIDAIEQHERLKKELQLQLKRKEDEEEENKRRAQAKEDEVDMKCAIDLYRAIKRDVNSIESLTQHISANTRYYLRESILDDIKEFFFRRPYSAWEAKIYDEILSNTDIAPCMYEALQDDLDSSAMSIAESDWYETDKCQSNFAYYLKCCIRTGDSIGSDSKEKLEEYISICKNSSPMPSQTNKNIVLRYALMEFYQLIQEKTSNRSQQLDYFQLILDNLKFITLVQSVFLGFIVGCKLPNWAGVINYVKQYHAQFGHLFIKAINNSDIKQKEINNPNVKQRRSFTNNFTKLEEKVMQANYKKDTSLDKLFTIIFPKIQW